MRPITLNSMALADSYTLRRLSANAVRYRLGQQLDWRLDLMLDATGLHILSLRGLYVLGADREVEELFTVLFDADGNKHPSEMKSPTIEGEMVVRTEALLKLPGTDKPLEVGLDLRMRDFVALPAPDITRRGETSKIFEMDIRGGQFIPDGDTPRPTNTTMERLSARTNDIIERSLL